MGGINSNTYMMLDGKVSGTVTNRGYSSVYVSNTNMTISAIASALGGNAWYFNGSTAFIGFSYATSLEFWSADYTLDWRMRNLEATSNIITARFLCLGSHLYRYGLFLTSKHITVYLESLTVVLSGLFSVVWSDMAGSFHHYAVTQESLITRCYLDGVKKQSWLMSGRLSNIGANATYKSMTIGQIGYAAASFVLGYVEQFRLTKGVALWSTDFTPSTEPYTFDLPTSELDLTATVNYPRLITSTALEYANKFRNDVVRKGIDLSADVIRGCLMSAGFAFDKDTHHYWSEIASYATSVQNLLTPTITENDTSDVISIALSGMSWTVSAIQSLAGILLYDETTSNIIGYISYPTTMPANMPLVVTGVGIKVS